MKKNISYIIIVLLVALLASGITYAVMKGKNDNNSKNESPKEEEKTKDGVKLLDINSSNNQIKEKFELTLNGKKKDFEVLFEKKDYSDRYIFEGSFGDIILVNNLYFNDEMKFDVDNIKKLFNENNLELIKGNDNKNYLLTTTYLTDESSAIANLLVFNDELKLISRGIVDEEENPEFKSDGFTIVGSGIGDVPCEFENGNVLYPVTFKTDYVEPQYGQFLKILDNKIYYLYPKLERNEDYTITGGTLEERVYEINNDKFDYKVINKYKITQVCNQT